MDRCVINNIKHTHTHTYIYIYIYTHIYIYIYNEYSLPYVTIDMKLSKSMKQRSSVNPTVLASNVVTFKLSY
jgi:hypothetical protein